MIRRVLAAALLAVGVGLLVRLIPQMGSAPRHAWTVGVIGAGGIALNVISVGRPHLPIRGWLRNLACAVGGVLLASVLCLRYWVSATLLPTVPRTDTDLVQALTAWQGLLTWLAIAVGYVVASIAFLPRPQRLEASR